MDRPNYPIVIFYSERDGGFIAIAPDLKGCSAFGETPEQAVRELGIAMNLWIEVALEDGEKLPEPCQSIELQRLCA